MNTTGNRHPRGRGRLVAAGTCLLLGLSTAGIVQAATCKDELDRFERRLHSSSLAATDPDTFQALARQAEEAALLRDEQQCLETVAALNEAIPPDADAGMRTSRGTTGANDNGDNRSGPSRPAAPVLLMAGGNEPDESDEQENAPGSNSGNPDDDQLDE